MNLNPWQIRRNRYLEAKGLPPEPAGLDAEAIRQRLDTLKARRNKSRPEFTDEQRVEIVRHLLELARAGKIGTVHCHDSRLSIGRERYPISWPESVKLIEEHHCKITFLERRNHTWI
jgi:hypothetical protein